MSEKVRIEKEDMQVRQQIVHELIEIFDTHSKYRVAQHMAGFLRRKTNSGPSFFEWSNKELLNRIEQYKKELEGEEIINEQED